MNREEFEIQYRDQIDQSLNQLQTAVFLLAQLEAMTNNFGQNLQNLSQIMEEFIAQSRAE